MLDAFGVLVAFAFGIAFFILVLGVVVSFFMAAFFIGFIFRVSIRVWFLVGLVCIGIGVFRLLIVSMICLSIGRFGFVLGVSEGVDFEKKLLRDVA